MNSSVCKLIRKEVGGTGRYYRQLKKAYKKMTIREKEQYVQKAKAMAALI